MVKIVLILLFSFVSIIVNAQKYTVVPIELGSEYVLDARSETLLGGKSKMIIPVELPKGTVRWYYKFATSQKERSNKNLQLLSELAAVVTGQTAIASIGKMLTRPIGELPFNVYLLESKDDITKFKNTLALSSFQYYESASREQLKSATIEINNAQYCHNSQYLAIQNPSLLHKAHFTIEIAAIVSEETLARTQGKEQFDKELEQKIIGTWKVGKTSISYKADHTYVSNSAQKGRFTGRWFIKDRNIYYIRDKGIMPKALYVAYITDKIMGYVPPKGNIARPIKAIKQ